MLMVPESTSICILSLNIPFGKKPEYPWISVEHWLTLHIRMP